MDGSRSARQSWSPPNVNSPFSAVLLAGGRSARMRQDKAFVTIDGEPLWKRQLRLLQELALQEVFLAGPAHAEWLCESCIIIPDAQPDAGPLGGIVSALRHCSTPLLLTLAVDLPNMMAAYLRSLIPLCGDARGIVPRRGGRFEPVAAIYPKAALAFAESCLASGNYSLQIFAARLLAEGLLEAKEIAPHDEPLFRNLNTPEDLLALKNG